MRADRADPHAILTRDGFAKLALGLPGVTLHEQWDALVAKVGGKIFALLGDSGALVFKVSETSFMGLTSIEGIGQAAYFAKGQWVNVSPQVQMTEADLAAYVGESHRIIAGKLTRKVRRELGLEPIP